MKQTLVFLFLSVLVISSCDKVGSNKFEYDVSQLLENITSNHIMPCYSALNTSSNALHTAIVHFQTDPTLANLTNARTELLATQLAWQGCSTFEFGPAADQNLRGTLNTYPTSAEKINANIASNSYSLNAAVNSDAIGFPALDYLLHGTGSTDAEILSFFSAPDARNYLIAVSEQINAKITIVNDSWTNGYDGYFISQTGTSVGSALGMLVNAMNLDFEQHIRDGKVGIPLGVRSLGVPIPENTEAFYSGNSKQLLTASIKKLFALYFGANGAPVPNETLYNYISTLDEFSGNTNLANRIADQILSIELSVISSNIPLEEAVLNNKNEVQELYTQMQQLVVLFKVDMSSTMGVLITYQDNDGD